ncbi:MAG: glycosyltransferase [Eubacterium sp.]|nr:glycosyltransferase [Eubacterium sp.]
MVSLIIPVYNAGDKLMQMLECVGRQTEKDLEILIIDDGSTDDSGDVCDNAARKIRGVRVFHQENKGVSAARNEGMRQAKGDYIAFVDADDRIPDNYIRSMRETLEKENADAVVTAVAYIENGVRTQIYSPERGVFTGTQILNRMLSRERVNSGPCGKLFRRRVIAGLSFPELTVYEDIVFSAQAFGKCRKVAALPSVCYEYLRNEAGAMCRNEKCPSEDVLTGLDAVADLIRRNKKLDAKCFYVTLSHLMQHVQNAHRGGLEEGHRFVRKARRIYRKYLPNILASKAFSAKEKIVYAQFALGGRRILR